MKIVEKIANNNLNELKWEKMNAKYDKWEKMMRNTEKWEKMNENDRKSSKFFIFHQWNSFASMSFTNFPCPNCQNNHSSCDLLQRNVRQPLNRHKKSFNLYALHIEQNNDKHSFLSHIYVYYSWVSFLCSNERVCRQPWTSSAINRAFRIFISILFGYYACIVCNCSCSFKISSVPQILLRRRERKRERWAFFFCFR